MSVSVSISTEFVYQDIALLHIPLPLAPKFSSPQDFVARISVMPTRLRATSVLVTRAGLESRHSIRSQAILAKCLSSYLSLQLDSHARIAQGVAFGVSLELLDYVD